MKIKINGKEQDFASHSLTIAELLKIAKVENPEMVSVQLNGEFAGKEKFKSVLLKEGDAVDFLYFMGGGSDEQYVPPRQGRGGSIAVLARAWRKPRATGKWRPEGSSLDENAASKRGAS